MNKDERWLRPWNIEKFDDLYNRDERFFAILVKGVLAWLNHHIVLYDKSINHFIFNTGSGYLYVESNGYQFSMSETSGEDQMYMQLPRCLVTMNSISVPVEDLSQPFSRGTYERRAGNLIKGYNAEIKRVPIELDLSLTYYLSNFNETIILVQELIDKILFQRYFKITYLGQIIECSIEFPSDFSPEINRIDFSSNEPNQRTLKIDVKVTSNYPSINDRSEIPNQNIIATSQHDINIDNLSKED